MPREDTVDPHFIPRPVHVGNGLAADTEVALVHFCGDSWVVEDDKAKAVVGRCGDPIAKPHGLLRIPSDPIRLSIVRVEEEEVGLTEGNVVVAGDTEEHLKRSRIERAIPVVVADRREERPRGEPRAEEVAHVGLVGGDALREGIDVVSYREDRGHAVEPHVVGCPGLDATSVAEVADHTDSSDGRGREGRNP